MTPEGKVKKKAREIYKKLGIYYVPVIGGHGSRAGIPDDLLCVRGVFVGVEYKSDAKKKPTKLQALEMQRIRKSGGMTLLVHAGNIELLDEFFKSYEKITAGSRLAQLIYEEEIK